MPLSTTTKVTNASHARRLILAAISPQELTAIWRAMIDKAVRGDLAAAKFILEQLVGKSPLEVELQERCEQLEELLAVHVKGGHNGATYT